MSLEISLVKQLQSLGRWVPKKEGKSGILLSLSLSFSTSLCCHFALWILRQETEVEHDGSRVNGWMDAVHWYWPKGVARFQLASRQFSAFSHD